MKKVFLLVLLILFFTPRAAAAEVSRELENALGLPALERAVPSEAAPYVAGLSPGKTPDMRSVMDTLSAAVRRQIQDSLFAGRKSLLLLLVCAVFVGFAGQCEQQTQDAQAMNPALLTGVLATAFLVASDYGQLYSMGRDAIQKMEDYAKTMLPVLTGACAVAGMPAGAGARHLTALLFSDIYVTLLNRFFVPLSYAYVAVLTADAAIGNAMLGKLGKLIRWCLTGLLTLTMTVYVAYLTLSGVIAGSADALAAKSTKLAISGAVPVVGGILADASETVLAGAGILKNSIGIFGLFTVLGIALTPFIRLGVQYLLYKLVAALAEPLTHPRLAAYIDKLADVFALMVGMTAASALVLLTAVISVVQMTT